VSRNDPVSTWVAIFFFVVVWKKCSLSWKVFSTNLRLLGGVPSPPKNGLFALWLATNRSYVVKCVAQKRNRSNNKNQWYNILVNFIFKFIYGLYSSKKYVYSKVSEKVKKDFMAIMLTELWSATNCWYVVKCVFHKNGIGPMIIRENSIVSRGNMGWSFSGTNFLPNCWRYKALAGHSGLWTPIQRFFSMKTQSPLRPNSRKMLWIQNDARLFSTRII